MSKGISASPLPDTEKSTPTRLVPGDELGSAESSNGEIEPDDAGDAEIVDGEPVDDVPEVIEERHRMSLELRAGPLPDPEAFAAYEAAYPGAADRILSMAEAEFAHQHQMEDRRREAVEDILLAVIKWAPLIAGVVFAGIIAVAILVIVRGEALLGVGVGFADLVIGALMYESAMGTRRARKDRRSGD